MRAMGKLDPRSKQVIFIVSCFSAFSGITTTQELVLMGFCMVALLLEGEQSYVMKIAFLFGLLYFLDIRVVENLSGVWQFVGLTICHCCRFFLPILASVHLVIHTSTIGEYISALMAMRCPNAIMIPIAVMFRFLPTIQEEFTAIRRAMKMRNLYGGFHMLEYALVPLLLQSSAITDELSATVMARGLERNSKRTSFVEVKMTWLDFGVIGLGVAFLIWTLFEYA